MPISFVKVKGGCSERDQTGPVQFSGERCFTQAQHERSSAGLCHCPRGCSTIYDPDNPRAAVRGSQVTELHEGGTRGRRGSRQAGSQDRRASQLNPAETNTHSMLHLPYGPYDGTAASGTSGQSKGGEKEEGGETERKRERK